MRDRLVELLPLVLAAGILLAFQLAHGDAPFAPPPLPLVSTPPPTALPGLAPSVARRAITATGPDRSSPACNPAAPRFMDKVALLRAALGSTMGDPVSCERDEDGEGNTQQKTTTGLAYYRKQSNVAAFTTGWDHWALLADQGLVYWASEAVDPPPNASPVTR